MRSSLGGGWFARVRAFWASLDRGQRGTIVMMAVVVAGLHVVGFLTLIALVAPHHYRLGTTGAFTVGLGVTAYTLGMRHAFDADHISAIDNTTRKLMARGQAAVERRLLVLARPFDDRVPARVPAVDRRRVARRAGHATATPGLHQVTSSIGTLVSGSFLYVIAALNIVILLGIVRVFRDMRTGSYDEAGARGAPQQPRPDEPVPRPA